MIKNKLCETVCVSCFLIGFGGLGGACETGKGFILSLIILAMGIITGKLLNVSEPTPRNAKLDVGSKNTR